MNREPAMIVAAIVAVLAVLGIQVAPEQSDAVTAGVAAVVAIVGGIITRSQVTPAGKASGFIPVAEAHRMAEEAATDAYRQIQAND